MKNFYFQTILTLLIIAMYNSAHGQQFFRKKYTCPILNTYKNDTIFLQQLIDSKKEQRDTVVTIVNGISTETIKVTKVDTKSFKKVTEDTTILGNLKFENNIIYINPWLKKDFSERENIYVYKLDNRRQVKLSYNQWTFSTIAVPVKVQFGKDHKTTFSSGISLGGIFGYSRGRTSFTSRKKIDNFSRSHDFTIGIAMTLSETEFTTNDNLEISTISSSIGLGLLYSYEKVNLGLIGGIEAAHGYRSSDWNYQGRPWLGILIGYSVFGD